MQSHIRGIRPRLKPTLTFPDVQSDALNEVRRDMHRLRRPLVDVDAVVFEVHVVVVALRRHCKPHLREQLI